MKLNITLDVSKINKDKIVPREYTNGEGVTITEKNYKMEAVPLKEKKFVAKGDNWIMYKTHFIAEAQTKEEKQQKAKSVFIGSGFQFETQEQPRQPEQKATGVNSDGSPVPNFDINPDEVFKQY
jgi:hypothetical protein